jgi:tRNA threonylcarbamoyladenosine biosynthesis protein TsaB
MNILAIETSTVVCSVALCHRGIRVVERRVVETHIHSEKLQTLIQEVCSEAGIALSRLDGVAVSTGPGSFTGLRIGVSAAKGLCYGLDRPLIGVSTFEALADAAFERAPSALSALLCIDARQGDFYVGRAEREHDGRSGSVAVHVAPMPFIDSMPPVSVVVTDRCELLGNRNANEILDVRDLCTARTVAIRGDALLQRGEISDLAALEPRYLKDFVVKTRAEVPQKQ